MLRLLVAFAVILMMPVSSLAQVYKWTDENGKVHFSDQKPESIQAEEVRVNVNTYTNVTQGNSNLAPTQKVVMYSTSWCGYCKKARQYFTRNRIPFVEYDIEKDIQARKRYQKLGASGVPVILYGKRRMNGFSIATFNQIYQK